MTVFAMVGPEVCDRVCGRDMLLAYVDCQYTCICTCRSSASCKPKQIIIDIACSFADKAFPSHLDATIDLITLSCPSGPSNLTTMKFACTTRIALSDGEHIDRISR